LSVTRNQFQRVKGDAHQTVDGEHRVHVQGDQTQAVDQTLHMKQGQSLLDSTSREIHLNGGIKVVMEAGAELTLKAGGSFMTINAAGVSASGPSVKLNSGGSASSGSRYGGRIAKLPQPVMKPNAPDEAKINATTASQSTSGPLLKSASDYSVQPTDTEDDYSSAQQATTLNTMQQRQALISAATKGKPICQTCEEAKESNA
ncbi:hypothetical protein EV690_0610, partial [Celerinatantimonas diazotrophica]